MYMKKISLLFLILILLVSLSGCPYPWVYANHPCNKYDTTWSTADGKSAFYIPEDTPNATGIIRTNRGSVFFYYYDDPVDSHVYLDRKDDPDMAEELKITSKRGKPSALDPANTPSASKRPPTSLPGKSSPSTVSTETT